MRKPFKSGELAILRRLFGFTGEKLAQERQLLHKAGPKNRRYRSAEGLTTLIRQICFIEFLSGAVGAVQAGMPVEQAVDITTLPDPDTFCHFLAGEIRRNELGVSYVSRVPYDLETRRRLLAAFGLERRFLEVVLNETTKENL